MDCGASRLLCSWDSPGKHTGVGCHALLQGILPNQGSNLRLLHHRWVLYHWASREALSRCPQSFGDLPYDRICHTLPLCLSQLSSSQKGRHCRALPPSLGKCYFHPFMKYFMSTYYVPNTITRHWGYSGKPDRHCSSSCGADVLLSDRW